jgi:hypothetical protein
MDDWDDDSFVCTALNRCFCRSCRSERYMLSEELHTKRFLVRKNPVDEVLLWMYSLGINSNDG